MKTIAVTGSSGFIGQYLVKSLKNKFYRVIELDYDKGFDLVKEKSIKDVPIFDIVIHLAARSYVPESFELPKEFYFNNYVSTLNVLELSRKFKAKVIYFSSYLYGEPEYLPVDEKHPIKPHNPYAQSKLICEKLCEGYNRDFNVPLIIFRPFNIYGKGQSNSFLIPTIIEQIKSGLIVLKDPRPKRDFIHIHDVVKAVMLAIEYNGKECQVFNLGYGKSHSIKELIEIIKKVSKISAKVEFINEFRPGEVLDTVANTSKLSSHFDWVPEIDLFDGITKIFQSNLIEIGF